MVLRDVALWCVLCYVVLWGGVWCCVLLFCVIVCCFMLSRVYICGCVRILVGMHRCARVCAWVRAFIRTHVLPCDMCVWLCVRVRVCVLCYVAALRCVALCCDVLCCCVLWCVVLRGVDLWIEETKQAIV